MNRPAPCGCPSVLIHMVTCKMTHPEVAGLPEEMPPDVKVKLTAGLVDLLVREVDRSTRPSEFVIGKVMEPAKARAVARALLLVADESERARAN